jgi:hypothetical protein
MLGETRHRGRSAGRSTQSGQGTNYSTPPRINQVTCEATYLGYPQIWVNPGSPFDSGRTCKPGVPSRLQGVRRISFVSRTFWAVVSGID